MVEGSQLQCTISLQQGLHRILLLQEQHRTIVGIVGAVALHRGDIDVAEPRQEEALIGGKFPVIECPECGMKFVLFAVLEHATLQQVSTYYCPYCGKDIDDKEV